MAGKGDQLIGRVAPLIRELWRSFLVGGVASTADFGTLVALTHIANLHYLYSAVVGFAIGLTINYLLSVSWVFEHRPCRSAYREILGFTGIALTGLALTQCLLAIGAVMLQFDYRAIKLISIAMVFVWNFSARKTLLFTASTASA